MDKVDLNCDLGEGSAFDAELIPLVTSVNIACGGHAGDDATMRETIRLAQDFGVNAGAHPSYEDRAGFGRVELPISHDQVRSSVLQQVRRLRDIAASESVRLTHVKPHGALYNVASKRADLAEAIAAAVHAVDPGLAVVCPPGSALANAASRHGLRFVAEGFIDRRYQPDGALVPRTQADAVIDDAAMAVQQAIDLVVHRRVTAIDGSRVALPVETLCVHGDNRHAVELLTHVRRRLVEPDVGVVIVRF